MDLKSIYNSESVLTYEMIHPQTDIAFTKELEDELHFIKSVVNKEDIKSSKNFFKAGGVEKAFKNISSILSKRFGFSINFIYEEGAGLCTVPVYPSEFNIITDIAKYYTGEARIKYKNNESINPKDIKDFTKSSNDVYKNIYKAYDTLNDLLNKSHVIIDLKNARIQNLPKEYNIFIIADVAYALHDKGLKWTPEIMVSGLLHEVGHSFTLFEKSIYSVKNTILLLDTVKEGLNSKNNNPDEIINISYKKITGKSSDGNIINSMIGMVDFLDGYNFGDDKSHQNSRIMAEQQADQFANRFGYGAEIVKLVSTFGETNYRVKTSIELLLESSNIATLILYIVAIILDPIAMFAFIIILLFGSILSIRDFNKNGKIYDTELRRYLRLKQDAIRQLRLYNKKDYINQEMFKRLEDTILLVSTKVDILTDPNNRSFLNKFIDKFEMDSKTKKVVNMVEISESLMENDLHYLNLKLKERL